MSLLVNLRHLEKKSLFLRGELTVQELELENIDEVIHPSEPLQYDLEVQKVENAILVQGSLKMSLQCDCVRCLESFPYQLAHPHWMCHLPLEGEERVVVTSDCVDLTPYIREDILLEFPQRPLCKPECSGLIGLLHDNVNPGGQHESEKTLSAWDVLDKLKL
jgi:DUF177 domain-containing protein